MHTSTCNSGNTNLKSTWGYQPTKMTIQLDELLLNITQVEKKFTDFSQILGHCLNKILILSTISKSVLFTLYIVVLYVYNVDYFAGRIHLLSR